MKKNRTLLVACVILLLLSVTAGCSQGSQSASSNAAETDWPKSPIKIYVGANTGGDSDFNARSLMEPLQKVLGQPINVVNIAGGTGSVMLNEFMSQPKDGYSFSLRHIDQDIINANGLTKYDWSDYEMAAIHALSPAYCFCVSADSKIKNMKDLAAAAKANPGGLKFAVNTGGTSHIMVINFADEAGGIEFNIIDGGSGNEKLIELIGGHVDVTILPYGVVKDYYLSKQVSIIGHTSPERNPLFPDAPTCKEQGYNVVWDLAYSLVAAKGTPVGIVKKMSEALKKIQSDEAYKKVIMDAYCQTPFYLDAPDALKWYANVRVSIDKYAALLKK
jgi:tripartite-type tricarboxylate transporter receptor subunit TctC